ncbi:MAG: PD-(D/E)XK nuclease family protein [Sulfurospirillaceae bacterium]|nr:PD-(D/E)XK nuclease family protein [Sulfurospirillaceae bacterium]MDD2827054.1 PD-(D/E)XK nuclease family protein [Sulfurospirillaceae bacterium]
MLEVFSTSRAVRSFYETFLETNRLLPKAITIAELEQKAILVPNRVMVDEDKRTLLMKEASQFARFELLHIEREFFVFLKNSQYLFRFFEELSLEKVAMEELVLADTYAHYAEHLEVLKTLLETYKNLLLEQGLYDKITLPECYNLNEAYIMSLGSIRIHLEGFLNRFEVELLSQIARLIPLHVTLSVNAYNQKMIELFSHFNVALSIGYQYEINLSEATILAQKPLPKLSPNQEVQSFSNRLAQIGYLHHTLARWISEGLSPEEIVVVLPDESFAPTLKSFDTYHNLNFAMGFSLKESSFYSHLSALEKRIKYDSIEDKLRTERLGFSEEFILTCKELWRQKIELTKLFELLDTIGAMDAKEMQESVFSEELFAFRHFLGGIEPLKMEHAVKLLLNRLAQASRDDVRGGKVTVLGILETRGVAYKGVIVLDFNDDFIPKRSQKDLFLSSAVRAHAHLPTKKDRENLQRYYYYQLLSHADNVALCYIANEMSMPSRFLDELGCKASQRVDEKLFYPLLLDVHTPKPRYECEFIDVSYSLQSAPLSATKLKSLLSCPRQFYFRYIAGIKDAKMPSSKIEEVDVGRALHKALEVALNELTCKDETLLYQAIEQVLKEQNGHVVWSYFSDVWMHRLTGFIAHEVARYKDGYRIAHQEISLKMAFQDFILEGQIDRIDRRENALYIIDYKSGAIPLVNEKNIDNTVDFQLEFYALLAQSLGQVGGVYYSELSSGKLIENSFLEEKLALLKTKLEELKKPLTGFEKCEEIKHCRFCPYVILCNREELV